MSEAEVVALMESATSEADWNAKANRVKAACGGYPVFLFGVIVMSGLAAKVAATFGNTVNKTASPVAAAGRVLT